jgi:imidazolonepropionase-like amidohydrolase
MLNRVPTFLFAIVLLASAALAQSSPAPAPPGDLVIRNATLLTATHGRIPNGSVVVHAGKIAAFGANVAAPAGALVIDAGGKYVTPGLIDAHSHMALDDDVNEATSPIVPQMMMVDAFQYTSKEIYRALAGGVTSAMLLHGSADMIGGQAVIMKTKYGLGRDQLLFPNAPRSIKFASGENPKRVFGQRQQLPSTRMGSFAVQRQALLDAQDYMRQWDEYDAKKQKGDKDAKMPKRDLKHALVDVLKGKLYVQIHCYRSDEFLTEMAMAKKFGYKLRAFHHALEAYKVADKIAANNVGVAHSRPVLDYIARLKAPVIVGPIYDFPKDNERYDAVYSLPGELVKRGVKIAFASYDSHQVRNLPYAAGYAVAYGLPYDEAMKALTINAAEIWGLADKLGSLDAGKIANLVVANGDPLDVRTDVKHVFIHGQEIPIWDRQMELRDQYSK